MYSHRNEIPQEFGQYADNDPAKKLSCIRASANTGPACIRAKLIPFPGHPTRQKTGASQKMDRSKKGPPEVPHREGALGDL